MILLRKSLLSAAACCLLILSGCGDDTSSGADAAPQDGSGSSPTAASQAAAFPVTIEHAYGTVTLDEAPARVITLGWVESDVVAALGVEPIAVSAFPFSQSGLTPWFEAESNVKPELLQAAASGASRPELNYERMLALKPDLIIANTYVDLGEHYERLSQIAPVLGPSQSDYAHLPWQDHTAAIGAALGKSDVAAELIRNTERAVDAAVAEHTELHDVTYTLALGVPGNLRLVQDEEDFAIQLLGQFGMVLNPRIAELSSLGDGSGGAAVSAETVEAIDADVVVIAYISDAARQEWESSPLFMAVPAVADSRYLPVNTTALTALRNPSPLSLPYAVEHIVDESAAAVAR